VFKGKRQFKKKSIFLNYRQLYIRISTQDVDPAPQDFSEYCNQVHCCKADQGWFYNSWADVYWERGEWDKVTEKLGMQLELARDKKIRTDVMKNLERAYLNWSYTYMNQRKWGRAADILKKCLAKYPKMRSCQKTLEKLKDEHGV